MNYDRIYVYRPSSNTTVKYLSRVKLISEDMPKGYYSTKEEAINEQLMRDQLMKDKRNQFSSLAETKLDNIENAIMKALNDNDGDMWFHYDGDSQGINGESIIISTTIEGIEFNRDLNL